ncbi:MAG: UPF0280 family protein [Planctomycetes bacterium]|nr:UPF0280 family protein [Planctomycetota bacterium]
MPRPEPITRFYRQWMHPDGLTVFRVIESQSDLLIAARTELTELATSALHKIRIPLQDYVEVDPAFASTLEPYSPGADAPDIVRTMAASASIAGVGPMAAVAGAIAEEVGRSIMPKSPEVIVENGGDIFMATTQPRVAGVYAGEGEFRDRIGLELPPHPNGVGIATSSATIGPSLSLGKADAATVIADTAALADACATALANRIVRHSHLKSAVEWCLGLPGVIGAIAVLGNAIAVEGKGFKIVPL